MNEKEIMMLGVMSLWRASPRFILGCAETSDPHRWVTSIAKILENPGHPSVKISTAMTSCMLAALPFYTPPDDPLLKVMVSVSKTTL
jgi:hypothetical protein